MNLTNMQRDQFQGIVSVSTITSFGAATTVGRTVNMQSFGVVEDSVSTALINAPSITVAANNWRGAGVFMRPPLGENTPYRIKAYATTFEANEEIFVFVGEGPATPAPGDNAITGALLFPLKDGKFDEIILVEPIGTTPVAVGIAIGESTTVVVHGNLSVQNLSFAPPQFSSSVS